jgi:hypothetical protein
VQSLFEWLRRLDARLLSAAPTSPAQPSAAEARWGAVLAVVGALMVLGAALLLPQQAGLQLGLVSLGLVMTVPYLQNRFDKVRATSE